MKWENTQSLRILIETLLKALQETVCFKTNHKEINLKLLTKHSNWSCEFPQRSPEQEQSLLYQRSNTHPLHAFSGWPSFLNGSISVDPGLTTKIKPSEGRCVSGCKNTNSVLICLFSLCRLQMIKSCWPLLLLIVMTSSWRLNYLGQGRPKPFWGKP